MSVLSRGMMVLGLMLPTSFSYALSGMVPCEAGTAAGHPCLSIDLAAKIDLGSSGQFARSGNDIWGWTDPVSGREYAIMGLDSKTAFVDVTDATNPVHVGDLATETFSSTWRDIKVYKNHAFIVSEAFGHGMQVFDLTRLRDVVTMPAAFTTDAVYTNFGSVHNIVINEESGFAYAVGSDTCDAGMHVVDIRSPKNPVFSTCVDKSIFEDVSNLKTAAQPTHGEDYTHDAQCLIYNGPDREHVGKEICVCSNADTVNIVDVSDKSAPTQLSVKAYSGLGYTHQGWLTEDQRYFILGDELDEQKFGHNTKTLIWDMLDLEQPKLIGTYMAPTKAIDHNMYVRGNLLYQSNYDSGIRILDITRVAQADFKEVAFFDTEPTTDAAQFTGAWSVYPYFSSQKVVLSNIDGWIYVLMPHQAVLDIQ